MTQESRYVDVVAVLPTMNRSTSWVTYLSPPLGQHLFIPFIAVASALGEIPLELWLIVMGVNVQRWKEQCGMKTAVVENTSFWVDGRPLGDWPQRRCGKRRVRRAGFQGVKARYR
jgi:hypothetical protein